MGRMERGKSFISTAHSKVKPVADGNSTEILPHGIIDLGYIRFDLVQGIRKILTLGWTAGHDCPSCR